MKIIIPLKIFKDFFACKIVLNANHHHPENIRRLFRLQNCLRRKTSLSWNCSKIFSPAKLSSTQIIIFPNIFNTFFPCKIVLDANHHYPEIIQNMFCLQNCLSRKSSLSWKNSKISSPAELSKPQIIIILEKFKDFLPCRIVLAANHFYPGNIQRLFHLKKCLSRK